MRKPCVFQQLKTLPLFFLLCTRSLLQIVTPENRLEWENFTVNYGEQWVDDYMELQKTDENFYGPIYEPGTYNISETLWGDLHEVIPYNITDRVYLPAVS